MDTISFETVCNKNLYIAIDIINSNPSYNLLENGREFRNHEEIKEEFLNPNSYSFLIKVDDTYIGIIDYMDNNPKDGYPWLGLLMIHGDYQRFGYGHSAYRTFEQRLKEDGHETIRLAVLKDNQPAHLFWKSSNYEYYKTLTSNTSKVVDCYQKKIVTDSP